MRWHPVDKIESVLRDHWLVSVNCDHEKKTDRAQCACSLIQFQERPSVQDAVNDWVEHVMIEMRNG